MVVPLHFRDYVMNAGLSRVAMRRVGRPFQGRRREEARRQARIDRAGAGKAEQVRFTISVEKYSREWSLIEPQENRSEFIRECVREYPTLSKQVRELKRENVESEAQVVFLRQFKREALEELDRLRTILREHSICSGHPSEVRN